MEPKSPFQYEVEINKDIKMVNECFSPEGHPKRCEHVLMKKLNEVYSLFHSTGDNEYKKLFSESFKKYNQILDRKISNENNLIKLENIELESTMLHPEEMEESLLMWRKSIGI